MNGGPREGERWRCDTGSLVVELVVLTPVLFLLVLSMVTFGRIAESRQMAVEAARAGAEAAAVLPDPSGAGWESEVDAAVVTAGQTRDCIGPRVITDVSHFYPGGSVTVEVTCPVELADVAFPGMPGSTTVTASATAPIDPYRSVG